MKTTLFALLVLSSAALAKKPAPGERAPAFAAAATNGKTLKLSDYANQTVVLAFYPKAFTGG